MSDQQLPQPCTCQGCLQARLEYDQDYAETIATWQREVSRHEARRDDQLRAIEENCAEKMLQAHQVDQTQSGPPPRRDVCSRLAG